jgi:hypothetical protein
LPVTCTEALPLESVTTSWADKPIAELKRIVAPPAEPPDDPALSVTEIVTFVAAVALWLSPVLVNVAEGLPTRIHPNLCCTWLLLSVPVTLYL